MDRNRSRRVGKASVQQEHRCLLMHVGREPERVMPESEQEIAELLGAALSEITPMQYGFSPGQERVVYMLRAEQFDKSVPINRAISHGVSLAGIAVLVRGPALLVVGGVPWWKEATSVSPLS